MARTVKLCRIFGTVLKPCLAVVGCLAVVAAVLVGAPSAAATEPERLVDITLTKISPALPKRDGKISLRGRVTNISDQPLEGPRLYFWRNQAPITSREGLDQALGSDANDPIGRRVVDNTAQELFTQSHPALNPGETISFSITVQVKDLELSPTDGIYLMGVHVLLPTSNLAIGRSRIFVPIVADTASTAPALRITSIALLSSRPSLIGKGLLSDDHLAGEVAPDGRLSALLAAAGSDTMSFAIDPALIEELQTMKSGYQVRQPDGSLAPGTGQADAGRWLDEFAEVKARRDGFRLPYATPDLAALTHDGQPAPLQASTVAAKRVDLTSSLPLLAFPAGGAADAATVKTAAALDPKAILLADTSAVGDGPLLTGPTVRGKPGPPIVSFTSGESSGVAAGGGPGPDPRNSAPQIQQRVLAETWIEATTTSGEPVPGRVRVITSAAEAHGDDLATDAPWLRRTTLSELLETVPATWSQKYHYGQSERGAELTFGQLDGIQRLTASYQTYTDLLVDRDEARAAGDSAIARAASGSWRGDDADRQAFLGPQQARLDEMVLNRIRISTSSRVQTVGREVAFPITVRNDLETSETDPDFNAVRLRLVFTSDNSQRLSIQPITIPLLRAEANAAETVEVVARANGTVPVRARLETEAGLPVGRPVTIDVEVTQNGTTGWAIAIGSGIVLVGSSALRIRQVSRARAAQSAVAEPAVTSRPPVDDAAHAQSATVAGERDV